MLGFTLDEVGSLLELDEACACAKTRELAAHKLQVIEEKLADLKAMRKALTALLHQCDTGATKGGCPIIHALALTDPASRWDHWTLIERKLAHLEKLLFDLEPFRANARPSRTTAAY